MTEDERPICRICGERIDKGEARYRDEEGDFHPDCYKRPRHPPDRP